MANVTEALEEVRKRETELTHRHKAQVSRVRGRGGGAWRPFEGLMASMRNDK